MFGRRNPDQPPPPVPQAPPEGDLDLDLLPDLPDIPPAPREPAPAEAAPADPAWHTPAPSGSATQLLPALHEPAPPVEAAAPWPPTRAPASPDQASAAAPAIPALPTPTAGLDGAGDAAPAQRPRPVSESVIGPDDFFDGRYRSERGVRIQGNARGSIESRQYIFVEGGAQVEADLSAEDITVAGSFSGKIECRRRLEVMASGRVHGQVRTALLVVQEGGMLDGQLQMRGDEDQAAGIRPAGE